MNDKDPKIEYELKSLADGNLPDADRILFKARTEMRRASSRKQLSGVGRFFTVAGAVAAVLLIFVFGIQLIRGLPFIYRDKGNGSDEAPSAPVSESGLTYAATALSARNVTYDEAANIFRTQTESQTFPVPDIDSAEWNVATLQLYVYRNRETGDDVLIVCRLRIVDDTHGNDELTLYFELTPDTYAENKEYLRLPTVTDTLAVQNVREAGEYVSMAYIRDNYRCMVQIMNGKEYRLSYYLENMFSIAPSGEGGR